MSEMVDRFFAYARERHRIYKRRFEDHAPPPWTDDPILQQYKFTNVFRELDRVTKWFATHVRTPMQDKPEVLLATVVFRWFTRIETGEAIFLQKDLFDNESAFDILVRTGQVSPMHRAIVTYCGDGPYCTGAYMIRSPTGKDKLSGMLDMVHQFNMKSGWQAVAKGLLKKPATMESVWEWLKEFECQGPFHSYEVVCDLRYTRLLSRAPDILTWGNPGPGCQRGAGRVLGLGTYVKHKRKGDVVRVVRPSIEETREVMANLLRKSRMRKYWPQDWPAWEMREVEHTLCEFDKYERARTGIGKPKARYSGGAA